MEDEYDQNTLYAYMQFLNKNLKRKYFTSINKFRLANKSQL